MKKVSVIGHFGNNENLLNGQTVKTKIITEELQNQLGKDQVIKLDTHGSWRTLLKAPFQVFKALKKSYNVLILPAHNGLRVYAPLLFFQKKLFNKRKIYYVVIGGWLPQFLRKRKCLIKFLKEFDAIYVETKFMKKSLDNYGFNNIYVMPNCKKLNILSEQQLIYPNTMPYKLCTFSRVMREKGIENAINAVIEANKKIGYQAYELDIYGQIDPEQITWFNELKYKFPLYISYQGCVDFDKSVNVLKEYFALLFPTYYEGEGMAGTIIDSYSAGVPVIASDWKYNSEIVNDETGFLFSTGNQEEFVNILLDLYANPNFLLNKKINCLKEAKKYTIENNIHLFPFLK